MLVFFRRGFIGQRSWRLPAWSGWKEGPRSGLRLARGYRLAKRALVALALICFGLAAALFLPRILALAMSQPYFALDEIVLRGLERVKGAELVALSGIREGESIWQVSERSVASRLESHPWVRDARVKRVLPRTVVIDVREWKPRAIVSLHGLYYVDRQGNIFARVGKGARPDFPFITGLSQPLDNGLEAFAGAAMRQALALLDRLEAAALDLEVSELHIDQQGGISVFFTSPAIVAEFGWGGWDAKVDHLKKVLARWREGRQRLALINLAYKGQAVVRLRGGDG